MSTAPTLRNPALAVEDLYINKVTCLENSDKKEKNIPSFNWKRDQY